MGYNYNLNSKLKATVYLAYSDFDGNINMSVPHNYERRITEQILYTHNLGKIPLDHRFRIEHRFFKKSNTNLNVARLRYRIGSTFNLNKTFQRSFYSAVRNEPYYSYKDIKKATNPHIDENTNNT